MTAKRATEVNRSAQILRATFARLDTTAIAVSVGCLGAALLWTATAILLVKGAPPGTHVGPHLGLLAQVLPGYSVTWSGSIVGLFYGLLIGLVGGGAISVFWNLLQHVFLMFILTRMAGGLGR